MKLKISENADPNYLATVVKIDDIKSHPNADRLQIVTIFGNDVIIAKDAYTVGELCVYFPVESCISPEFLSWANLYENTDKNQDPNVRGFFQKHGRVKAIALRGIPSQGFLMKTSILAKFYGCEPKVFPLGMNFDTVGEDILLKKYVKSESKQNEPSVKKSKIPSWINNTVGYLPRPIRVKVMQPIVWYYGLKADEGVKKSIVDGQFAFHYKTEHFGKNLWLFRPDDMITITPKLHGTSAIFGNILCKKKKSVVRSLKKLLGFKEDDLEYKMIYSSRSVLKNRRDGKYTDDVWGKHAQELEGKLPTGTLFYGEIVGWSSGGKCIQKDYDYGVTRGESMLYIYRITQVTPEGETYELNSNEIKAICNMVGLNYIQPYYQGTCTNLFPGIPQDDDWGKKFLEELKEKYLDKTCELCTTGVVNEGIVIKIDDRKGTPVYKFKSPKFLIKESADRDNNEEDMEENA